MSEALQTPTAEMTPVILVGKSPAVGGVPMDKLTNKVTLYSGVVPLTMTIEAMVEEIQEELLPPRWYITLHLTGFGTAQRVFISETVPAVLDAITVVPFPPVQYPVGANQYGLDSIGTAAGPGLSMEVRLSSPTVAGTAPSLQIINTTMNAEWVIGAIDILITDPPVVLQVQS